MKSSTKCTVLQHIDRKYFRLNFFNWFDCLDISKRSKLAKELALEPGDTLEVTFRKVKK